MLKGAIAVDSYTGKGFCTCCISNKETMNDPYSLLYPKRLPTVEEFLELRGNAGWGLPRNQMVQRSLSKTIFSVCAEIPKGNAIGMGRIVGDGGIQLFITDVIVHRDWQKRGVGKKIMGLLMEYIEAVASPATFVGLFSAFGREGFYNKFGFISRPNEIQGAGMVYNRPVSTFAEASRTHPFSSEKRGCSKEGRMEEPNQNESEH